MGYQGSRAPSKFRPPKSSQYSSRNTHWRSGSTGVQASDRSGRNLVAKNAFWLLQPHVRGIPHSSNNSFSLHNFVPKTSQKRRTVQQFKAKHGGFNNQFKSYDMMKRQRNSDLVGDAATLVQRPENEDYKSQALPEIINK